MRQLFKLGKCAIEGVQVNGTGDACAGASRLAETILLECMGAPDTHVARRARFRTDSYSGFSDHFRPKLSYFFEPKGAGEQVFLPAIAGEQGSGGLLLLSYPEERLYRCHKTWLGRPCGRGVVARKWMAWVLPKSKVFVGLRAAYGRFNYMPCRALRIMIRHMDVSNQAAQHMVPLEERVPLQTSKSCELQQQFALRLRSADFDGH